MKARRYRVRGRVQGVGFRFFTRRRAQRLGLRGWVRNVADGSVEAMAAGSEEALAAFEAALAQGPAGARVSGVDAELDEPGDAPEDFVITY